MTQQLHDSTGAPVTVGVDTDHIVGAYIVKLADGTPAGRAEFVDCPDQQRERVFFHTEVDQEFAGRGLAGLLVREALADSIRRDLTVVPVCPLFAGHLKKHGDEFLAGGGRFRRPTPDDIAFVTRTRRTSALADS